MIMLYIMSCRIEEDVTLGSKMWLQERLLQMKMLQLKLLMLQDKLLQLIERLQLRLQHLISFLPIALL